MTNNFEKMMETMMEAYMEKAMASMMEKMFSSMVPTSTPAEVEKPHTSGMSRDEFLALADEAEPEATPTELDFTVSGRTVKYNGFVPKDIWTVNHIAITKLWKGRWSSKNKGYIFESTADLRRFLSQYQIKTKLTDEDRHNIKVYNAEKAQRELEYAKKKAEQYK